MPRANVSDGPGVPPVIKAGGFGVDFNRSGRRNFKPGSNSCIQGVKSDATFTSVDTYDKWELYAYALPLTPALNSVSPRRLLFRIRRSPPSIETRSHDCCPLGMNCFAV